MLMNNTACILHQEFIQHAILGGNIEVPRPITPLHWENALKNRPIPVDYHDLVYCKCGYPVASNGYEYKDNIRQSHVFICNWCYHMNLSMFVQYDKSLKRPIDDMIRLRMPDLNATLVDVRHGISSVSQRNRTIISEVVDKLEKYGHFSKEKLRYLDFRLCPQSYHHYPLLYEGIRLAFYGVNNYGYILIINLNDITLWKPGTESIKYDTSNYANLFIQTDILKLL